MTSKESQPPKHGNFVDSSHAAHREHYSSYLTDKNQREHSESWLREDTVNAWLVNRLMATIDPLLTAFPGARWLTVGDGRYGNDAYYINESGGDALPSDISVALLKEAVRLGRIQTFSEQNAENLTFASGSFDFVLCKESFHHFPRPWLALYEMLRVARRAVVLIEPNDHLALKTPQAIMYRKFKAFFYRWILGRDLVDHEYEDVGNYIYTISQRELTKVVLGLNFPAIAFQEMNTHYMPGTEQERLSDRGVLYRRIRNVILYRNMLSVLGLKPSSVLTAILFKEAPSQDFEKNLRSNGYKVMRFSGNPNVE